MPAGTEVLPLSPACAATAPPTIAAPVAPEPPPAVSPLSPVLPPAVPVPAAATPGTREEEPKLFSLR